MIIAVEGCLHGELTKVYQTLNYAEKVNGIVIDILLICGDFQSLRNEYDMHNMKCPQKYLQIGDFYKYYSGELVAPYLTIFIGGNHEASNYLQELYFGGWVAPKIYYMGASGIIRIKKGDYILRVGGISGIFDSRDFFTKKKYETLPLNQYAKTSVYHTKQIEILKFSFVKEKIDIFLSHDWPTGIYNFGDKQRLLKTKPYFKKEVAENSLGSPALAFLCERLKPSFWFAAHLHVKFAALLKNEQSLTRFLALDKCLPRREFLQILRLDENKELDEILIKEKKLDQKIEEEKQEILSKLNNSSIELYQDLEWLSILKHINSYYDEIKNEKVFDLKQNFSLIESKKHSEYSTEISNAISEFQKIFEKSPEIFKIAEDDFKITSPPYNPSDPKILKLENFLPINPQTSKLLHFLNIEEKIYENVLFYYDDKKKSEILDFSCEIIKSDDKLQENKNPEEIELCFDEPPLKFDNLQTKDEVKKEENLNSKAIIEINNDELPFL